MERSVENKKLLEVIGIVLQLHNGRLYSKTKLVKLLYLLDRHFANKYGRSLTGLRYTSYFYGPYSDDIESALDYLARMGYITIRYEEGFYGSPYYVLTLVEPPRFSALTDQEATEVREFVSNYVDKSLEDILEEVYDTEEYKNAEFGEVIELGRRE